MNLPNADQAIVEQEKVIGYLLNTAHRFGASKARFFRAIGFAPDQWEVLATALRDHGRRNPVTRETDAGFGPRYQVDGNLMGADGRSHGVRTVWQLDERGIAPRLITAYPLEE